MKQLNKCPSKVLLDYAKKNGYEFVGMSFGRIYNFKCTIDNSGIAAESPSEARRLIDWCNSRRKLSV